MIMAMCLETAIVAKFCTDFYLYLGIVRTIPERNIKSPPQFMLT